MIASMTGFVRRIEKTNWGEVTWSLRALNHRALDINLQLPDMFRPLESLCRRTLVESFGRGRIEAALGYSRTALSTDALLLDDEVLQSLQVYADSVEARVPGSPALSVAEILKWPGVIRTDAEPEQPLNEKIVEVLDAAIADLTRDRHREGALVEAILMEKLKCFKADCMKARTLVPEAQQSLHERMTEKLAELDIEVDPGRWEQEIGLTLVKLDVAEEVDRIDWHVEEFERVLANEAVVGKRLGFIVQELGREVNTLGSKTVHYPLNALTVEMKVTLEQIREQIQNVE